MALPRPFSRARRSLWSNFDTYFALFADGDSITAGNHTGGVSYINYLNNAPYQGLVVSTSNYAVGSSTLTNLNSRAAALDAAKPSNPRITPVLVVMCGINDLFQNNNVATFLSNYATYLDARRTAGWKVVVVPIISDTGDVGLNALRDTANATIVTWASVHADAIVDSSDANIWADAAADNLTYFLSDKVHPNLTGQALIAGYVSKAISGLAK